MTVDHSLKALFQHGITIILLAGFGVMSAGAGWIILEKMSLRFKGFMERLFFSTVMGFGILDYVFFFLVL
jgi:hypothetical protein